MTELEHAIKHIKTRADAWAVKEVEKALSQEPCDDAISRDAVIEICNEEWDSDLLVERIEHLPSVTQKSGKWIRDSWLWKCSKCNKTYHEKVARRCDFCPNCGCSMKGDTNDKNYENSFM